MIFDTLKKKNRAEAEEQAWNANRPADYVSRNKDAMDAVTGQVGSGFDWDTADTAYQQYRNQGTANAQAAAQNAAANAAALAGGYGSSYADSVAKQGQQQALAAIDNAVPGLQSKALSQYQSGQNDLLSALSGMANTEALDRSAYGANLSNYEYWQNFLANQSQQARTENDNFWNNIWNGILNAGNVVKTAYDGYMGYTQQQQQMAMQEQQAKWQAAELAMNVYKAGNPDLALAIAQDAGFDSSIFDNYTGEQPTWQDKLNWLSTASGLTASGDPEAAQSGLNILGMPLDSIASYDNVAGRAFDDYARKQSFVKALSGGSSGSSGRSSSGGSLGSSSKSSGEWTKAQLRNIATDYRKMSDTDELKPTYRKILQDAGWLEEDSGTSSSQSGGSIGLAAQKELNQSSKWAPLAANTTSTGNQSKSSGMPYSNALSYAKGWKADGVDEDTIYARLVNLGITDDVAAKVWNAMGW